MEPIILQSDYNHFKVGIYNAITNKTVFKTGVDVMFAPEKTPLLVGIDQSTTQTGLCITTLGGKVVYLVDIINTSASINRDLYIKMFEKWMVNNFKQFNFKTVVYEEMGQNARQESARRLLKKITAVIEKVCSNSLHTEFVAINNGTWKKHFLKDPKFEGRRRLRDDVKASVQEHAMELYPNASGYIKASGGRDSCDAMGIALGYLEEAYASVPKQWRKVNKTMKDYPIRTFQYYVKTMDNLKDCVGKEGYKLLWYNSEMPFEENCFRAINWNSKGIVLFVQDMKGIRLVTWDNDKAIKDNKCLVVVSVPEQGYLSPIERVVEEDNNVKVHTISEEAPQETNSFSASMWDED